MYCTNCGRPVDDAEAPCLDCGYRAGSADWPASTALQSDAGTAGDGGVQKEFYAGFWIRLAALVIDAVVLGVAWLALALLLMAWRGGHLATVMGVYSSWTNILVSLLYHGLFESSSLQGTLGKRAVGIKVTDDQGEAISIERGFGRALGRVLSGFLLLFGFFMVSFTRRRQGLHDKLADTRVVYRRCTAAAVQAGPMAPRASVWSVFGAFVLTLGIPLLGIAMGLAVPLYMIQHRQAEVDALYQESQAAMQAIVDQHERTGTLPRSIAQSDYSKSSPLVRNVSFDPGTTTVTAFGAQAPLNGAAFQLQWQAGADEPARPVCHSRDIPARLMPDACRKAQ